MFVVVVFTSATCCNEPVEVDVGNGDGGDAVVIGVVTGMVVSKGSTDGSNADRDDLPLMRRNELFLLMRRRSWRDVGRWADSWLMLLLSNRGRLVSFPIKINQLNVKKKK